MSKGREDGLRILALVRQEIEAIKLRVAEHHAKLNAVQQELADLTKRIDALDAAEAIIDELYPPASGDRTEPAPRTPVVEPNLSPERKEG
jgi:uncharacterized coiled-coil protein SlyX